MPLTSGSRLGLYEVLAPLGAGGMGEVYRARDTKLGREVAIKVLPEAFSHDADKLARFQREAHLLASLNHPNVATLHGLEESDGQQFLVMELVEGETLAERLVRGPMPVAEALELFQHIASGLEAAHEKGIVHRDLKPANIKITPDGTPKVLDFGLAKAIAGEPVAQDLSQSPTLTRDATETGVLLGTAPYMSPEQARGKPVDKRTDVWAFGCCLYESLTGKAAFVGETVSDTIARILEREPDWGALPVTTPPLLLRLLRRCLEKSTNDRLHDIADARIELRESADEPESVEQVSSKRTLALLAVAVIAAALLGWYLKPAPPPVAGGRFEIVVPDGVKLNAPERATDENRSLALSPDGKLLAYVAMINDDTRLFLRDRDRFESRPLRGTEGASAPFFSPDGQWIAFFVKAQQELKKVAIAGGDPVTLCGTGIIPRGGTWTSNGSIVFSANQEGLYQVSEEGGRPEPIAVPPFESGLMTFQFPSVIPGSNQILFSMTTAETDSYDQSSVAVLDLEKGAYRVLLEEGFSPQYAQSGHLVFARSGGLFALPFDARRPASGGAPVEVLHGVSMTPTDGGADFTISPDGTLAYVPAELPVGNRLVWVDCQGTAERLPLEPEWLIGLMEPVLAPDGKRIAFSINGPNEHIWIYDIQRDALTRLTSNGGNRDPQWTPDGARVIFRTRWRGERAIRWKAPESSRDADLLYTSNAPGYLWYRGLHPNGSTLAIDQSGDIWTVPLEGPREPIPLIETPFQEGHATFSPNGRWIAYVSDETGQSDVFVAPFPLGDQRWRVSRDGGTDPVWSPRGDEIFFRLGRRFMTASFQENPLRIGRAEFLFEGNYGDHFDVAPDGQRLLMIEVETVREQTRIRIVQNWVHELKRLVPTDN